MRTLPVLLTGLLWLSLACGGESVPTPWSKTEGREEVVGNPDRGRTLVAEPQVEHVEPEATTQEVLPPVDEDYSALHDAGVISECPSGTTLTDDRTDAREMYCVLPDGRRHGPFMLWHNNGQVREIGTYVGGRRHGIVTTWTRDGKKYSVYTWKNGAPSGGQVFH